MLARIWAWYPPVGVFIGVLALLSVVVPLLRDLAKITKVEKAVWTTMFFALVGLELRSIYLDRRAHDREQATLRQEQLQHFTNIATGLTSAINQEHQHFDTTVSEMKQLIKSSDVISGESMASLNSVTGGDSFCFLELNGTRNGLVMFHPGDFQLTDVSVELTDYSKSYDENFERQTVRPHTAWPYRYELVNGDREDFLIRFAAINGFWIETLQLRKVNGVWQQALKVERAPKKVKLHSKPEVKLVRTQID